MTSALDIDALLGRMSLEAMVAQLGSVRIGSVLRDGAFAPDRAREAIPHGIGRVTRVGRESGLDPDSLAEVISDLQSFLRSETPHGIPALVREESVCGYAGRRGAVFPQAIGIASTWDPNLAETVAETIGEQLRAVGCRVTLSPVADLGVEPRWGRIEETFGEDPRLTATMTERVVAGLSDAGVDATLKHFVGHGRPAGGRNRARPTASLHEMRDTDLLPFRAGIDAGAPSVMAAYNTVDGVPCHASRCLLTDVLREEWGFDGTVVSDGRGIRLLSDDHGVAADRQAAGVAALRAGVDVELPETECFGGRLVVAVREGVIEESAVETAARRHLRQKASAGLFGDRVPAPTPTTVGDAFGSNAVRSLARRAARRSQVLLHNDGVLPLSADASIAIVGPNADDPRSLLGNYSYAGAENAPGGVDVVTPRSALQERADIGYARGCGVRAGPDDDLAAAVAAAEGADVTVAVAGGRSGIDVERDSPGTTGEALDRAKLGLSGRQPELIDRVAATGTPLVVVVVSGRPLALPDVVEAANATLLAWLPGQEGGPAIADALFGTDPGGRLPVSLPRAVGQLPIHYRQHAVSRGEYVFTEGSPLFPFGHGESYAAFAIEDLSVEPDPIPTDGRTTASVAVENVSDRPGTEVVQLYAGPFEAGGVRPERELVGFARADLAAGERATVRFDLPVATLARHDSSGERRVVPGELELAVGRSAGDVCGRHTLKLTGDPSVPDRYPAVARATVRTE